MFLHVHTNPVVIRGVGDEVGKEGGGGVRPRSTYLLTQLSALTGGLAVNSDAARRRFDSTLGRLSFLSLKTVWFQCGQCLVTAASRRSIIYKTFTETACTAAHLD